LGDGPAAGQGCVTTGIQYDGKLSPDGDMIVLSATEPVLQQVVLTGGYAAKRYCGHTITLMRDARH
jgi:hypothetical protein